MFLYVSLLLFIHANIATGSLSKIHPELTPLLKKESKVNIIIRFTAGTKVALDKAFIKARPIKNRGQRNKKILELLDQNADTSQAGVIKILATKKGKAYNYYKQYKSDNLILVNGATSDLVEALTKDPQVSDIEKEPLLKIIQNTYQNKTKARDQGKPRQIKTMTAWHPQKIQLAEAWAELGGRNGDGVIVGSIDTGVTPTHESVRDNFVGKYGWFNPNDVSSQKPYDADKVHYHGTAAMSIAVGRNSDVGIAPGAKWMTCLACDDETCSFQAVMDCIQFMECPTLPDKSQPDCSKAPHVVANAWQFAEGTTQFNDFVQRWRRLGIVPVFAVGNGGPLCHTAASPGDYQYVIGVGATSYIDTVYLYNGVGPGSNGAIEPDIMAPGETVKAASGISDDYYTWRSGTSIASPMVAGVVALLLVRNLELSYENLFSLLVQNTDQTLVLNRKPSCGNDNLAEYPNNYFGYGRVNAFKAVRAQSEMFKENNH